MLIVDVYNILHARRSGTGADVWSVATLLDALSFGRYAGEEIVLVCDGSPERVAERSGGEGGRDSGRVRRVLFANTPPHNREADDLIEELAEDAADPRRVTIVSSDRRLRTFAARLHARSVTARDFLAHLATDIAKQAARGARARREDAEPLDAASVAWWMGYFEGRRAAEPAPTLRKDAAKPGTKAGGKKPGGSKPATRPAKPAMIDIEAELPDPSLLDMEQWLTRHPPPKRSPRR
ncbi:MAG: NYN domain-containing protein [Tepidisphaera sp.]